MQERKTGAGEVRMQRASCLLRFSFLSLSLSRCKSISVCLSALCSLYVRLLPPRLLLSRFTRYRYVVSARLLHRSHVYQLTSYTHERMPKKAKIIKKGNNTQVRWRNVENERSGTKDKKRRRQRRGNQRRVIIIMSLRDARAMGGFRAPPARRRVPRYGWRLPTRLSLSFDERRGAVAAVVADLRWVLIDVP